MHPNGKRLLAFIREFIDANKYAPSGREMQAGTGFSSTSLVDYHLNLLEKRGYIVRPKAVFRGRRPARTVVLTEKGREYTETANDK